MNNINADILKTIENKIKQCPICGGTRKLPNGDWCKCTKNALDELRNFSGIPQKYLKYNLSDYTLKDSVTYKNIQKYINKIDIAIKNGMGLFLWGQKYSGKTFLAIGTLRELLKKGYKCYFVNFGNILSWYQSDTEKRNFIFNVDFLCIDKIIQPLDIAHNVYAGTVSENPTHYVSAVLEGITNRGFKTKPTFITSELPIKNIYKKFGMLAMALREYCLELNCESNDLMYQKMQDDIRAEFGFDELK